MSEQDGTFRRHRQVLTVGYWRSGRRRPALLSALIAGVVALVLLAVLVIRPVLTGDGDDQARSEAMFREALANLDAAPVVNYRSSVAGVALGRVIGRLP